MQQDLIICTNSCPFVAFWLAWRPTHEMCEYHSSMGLLVWGKYINNEMCEYHMYEYVNQTYFPKCCNMSCIRSFMPSLTKPRTLINFSIFPIKISFKLFSKKKKKIQPSWQVRAVVGVTGKACPWVGSSPLGFGYENMVHKANSTKAPTEDD